MNDFKRQFLKIDLPKKHKASNSYDCRDYYRYYKSKTKTKIPEKTYTKILHAIFLQLIEDYLLQYLVVTLPQKMGDLYVINYKWEPYVNKSGKYVSNHPVRWNDTLDWWSVDEEARNNKVLLRYDFDTYNALHYKTKPRSFRNRNFYRLKPCRRIVRRIFKELTCNDKFIKWQNNTPQ